MKRAARQLQRAIGSSTLSASGFLAVLLVSGLVAVVPVAAVTLGGTIAGKVPVMLVALTAVGGIYLAVTYVLDSFRCGVYVAAFVLSTFAANFPLASDQYFRFLPGSLGPQIWLVQAPLALLVLWLAYDGAFTRDSLIRTELLFGGFVLWSVLSAAFSGGPRTDVALFFSWLQFQALLVFMIVRRGVERGHVTLPSIILTYAVAVVGHVAFSAGQLWTQNHIGVSYLGESISWNAVTYGLLGVDNRVIASGLTGHGYVLVVLILLTFPGILWLANHVGGRLGSAGFVGAVTAAISLRLTTSDAGRGAFLVLVAVLLAGFALVSKVRTDDRVPGFDDLRRTGVERALPYALTLAFSVFAVLFPSSKSSASSDAASDVGSDPAVAGSDTPVGETTIDGNESFAGVTTVDRNESPAETTTVGDEVPLRTTTTAGNETSSGTSGASSSATSVGDLSVPLFDLTNLGVRVQQYVVGADIFRRNPILGVGGGNYPYVAQSYGVQNKMQIPLPHSLHNIYLMLLAETGFVGFVLYFATVTLVCWTGVQSAFHGRRRHLRLSVLAGLISYLAFGFFSHPIDKLTALLPFWAFAAALVGASRVSKRSEGKRERR